MCLCLIISELQGIGKCYLDKILNSDEVILVAVLYPT